MSMRPSSSAVGVRPTPYVGDCAIAGLAARLASSNGIVTTLSNVRSSSISREPIGHTPVPVDLPGHHAVVEPRHPEVPIEWHLPPIGHLLPHRLPLPDVVDAARHDFGRGSIPSPLVGEADVRHALRSVLE